MEYADLTKRQVEILKYIKKCIAEQHVPPSVREIGDAIGLSSPSSVHVHLKVLEDKGYITRSGSKSRSMFITQKADDDVPAKENPSAAPVSALSLTTLPLVGEVAAGTPLLAEQNILETIPLPISLVGDSGSFLLTVHGDSMIEAGIFNGDVLVVKEQSTADNGQIVVALLEDGATVKTYYKEKDHIRLQPENASMSPIYAKEVRILGTVVGLFRSF